MQSIRFDCKLSSDKILCNEKRFNRVDTPSRPFSFLKWQLEPGGKVVNHELRD